MFARTVGWYLCPKHGVKRVQVRDKFEDIRYEMCVSTMDSEDKTFSGGISEVVRI